MNEDKQIEAAAAVAAEQEEAAKAEPDRFIYVHTFRQPFTYQGQIVDTLTFDWGKLTGADHLAIESRLLSRGISLVAPAFTGEFLWGMAVRACTNRHEDGRRLLDMDAQKAVPMRDFQAICNHARSFLLRAEQPPNKAATGSENNA